MLSYAENTSIPLILSSNLGYQALFKVLETQANKTCLAALPPGADV